MKEYARSLAIATIVIAIVLPTVYVGGEGIFYLASGRLHFPPGSGYRTLYGPLDALGDRWPAIYEARESLASGWLRLGGDFERRVVIRPNPWSGFTLDVF